MTIMTLLFFTPLTRQYYRHVYIIILYVCETLNYRWNSSEINYILTYTAGCNVQPD